MPLYLLYPLYTAGIFLVMLAVVPRERIRRLVPYALLYGAVGDFAWLLILGYLGIAGYINFGPFGFGDAFFPCWPGPFLYHLPPPFAGKISLELSFYLSAAAYSLIFQCPPEPGYFRLEDRTSGCPAVVYLTWMISGYLYLPEPFHKTRVRP